ncbi:MAG: hypothetical protein ABIB47_00870 [Candidatus Woesearchaeota archaeon]
MALKEPTSAGECVYFTNRNIGNGKVKAWVFKGNCPKCGKGLMGKPKDAKTGKVKIRAKEYVCSECGYTVEQKEYEESLTASIRHTCPYCGFEGETEILFKRKKIQIFNEETQKKKSAEALRFACSKCGKNIDVTKKMK